MDLFAFSPAEFLGFLLTLVRVSFVMFLMPFYGGEYIPLMVKGALAMVMTLTIYPHLSLAGAQMPANSLQVMLLMVNEAVLGLTLGLCVDFIFAAIQTGGEIMGFQMGFTMVSLADPISGARVSVTSHVLFMVVMMVFLVLDGHLFLLRALGDSFTMVPAGGFRITGPLLSAVIDLSATLFTLAMKIAAPVIAALFMVELTLAFMGRAAPQMNLLTLGFPIKIGVGFFFMGILFTTLSLHIEEIIMGLGPMFRNLMSLGVR